MIDIIDRWREAMRRDDYACWLALGNLLFAYEGEDSRLLASIAWQHARNVLSVSPLTPQQEADDFFAANPRCMSVYIGALRFERK